MLHGIIGMFLSIRDSVTCYVTIEYSLMRKYVLQACVSEHRSTGAAGSGRQPIQGNSLLHRLGR